MTSEPPRHTPWHRWAADVFARLWRCRDCDATVTLCGLAADAGVLDGDDLLDRLARQLDRRVAERGAE